MAHQDFDAIIAPHLDAAFNYARWLTRNDADAEDVLQDAAIRALGSSRRSGMTMRARGCSRSCGTRGTDGRPDRATGAMRRPTRRRWTNDATTASVRKDCYCSG
jgi:hypothetical protein